MKTDSIVIGVLYNHFYNMKVKGRNVVPWFQTTFVLSLSIVITFFLVSLIFLEIISNGYFTIRTKEAYFLVVFGSLIVLLFFVIRNYYFKTEKYLAYFEEFLCLPSKKQKAYKIVVLSIFAILPFLCLLVLYLFDKR